MLQAPPALRMGRSPGDAGASSRPHLRGTSTMTTRPPLTEDRIREVFRARAETGPRAESLRAIAALQRGAAGSGHDPEVVARLQAEARAVLHRARAQFRATPMPTWTPESAAQWVQSFAAALDTRQARAVRET